MSKYGDHIVLNLIINGIPSIRYDNIVDLKISFKF